VVLVRRLVRDASEASAELARRQQAAGTLSDLALANELGMASQVRLDLRKSEGEATIARERLTRLMGMWGARTAWKLAPRLPELPPVEVPLDRLESLAITNRLDIGAARREVQAIDSMLSLTSGARWTGLLNVEVQAARLRGSKRIAFGPRASIELPLFDQRQAAVARLESLKRSSEDHLQAMSIDVRSEVSTARSRLLVARDVVDEYRKVLVPQREAVVRLSQEQYDAMLIGVHQLLNAKQAEFATYKEYIEALRDYWIARSDLERAVATRLVSPNVPSRGAP
jgi:cobalt-zinc-cadmium efflux system outer membrane protein